MTLTTEKATVLALIERSIAKQQINLSFIQTN